MAATETPDFIINVDAAETIEHTIGERWGGAYKVLTPAMRPNGGHLGIHWMRVPSGRVAVPFHAHLREDEVFYVLSGRGVLRLGDALREVGPGDCISCPAGGAAHQLANPFEEDLVYLAIGTQDAHEVCTYPDSGKVLIRGLNKVGRLESTDYMDGEPDEPRVFALVAARERGDG
ncbi:MAG: cupin domain-containing protein [Nannocystaceae bacterium]